MFYLVVGLVMLYVAITVSRWDWVKNDMVARLFMHCSLIAGVVFLAYWGYLYVVLPEQISQFSNNGSGLTFTNAAGSLTAFNSTDESVLYYVSNIKDDWTWIQFIKDSVWMVALAGIGIFMLWYIFAHNILGARIDDNRDLTGQAIREGRRLG